jgi:pyruvate dehydrogenase E2 component (dihydrolipoamide acetyltransferase)
MSDVNMPKLSDTMEEGTVLEWKKRDGEEVQRGDVLAEIESDKASFEIEAEAGGTLHIVVEKGQAVPVGDLIGRIGGDEAPADGKRQEAKSEEAEPEPAEAEPESKEPEAAEPEAAEAEPKKAEPEPERPAARVPEPEPAPAREAPAERVKASPLARRLADEMGVDLAAVRGTGPEGRILKEDVLAAAEQPAAPAREAAPPAAEAPARPQEAPARPQPAARPATGDAVESVAPSRMQATIARRMTESKTTVPHFYVTVEARVDDAVRVRQQLKESVPGADRVTMTDLLTRACAIALTRFPEVNASWVDGRFERKQSVSIGLAVPPAQGLGLLVPVVRDVHRKDLVQISIDARQVIERARSGRPSPGDLEGGTFSISNLGMYGVDEFSAIINPPESAILAVGAIKQVPVVEDGRVTVGQVMRMTLSVDHRVFYGATAAQFMAEVKRLVEHPVTLLVPPEA